MFGKPQKSRERERERERERNSPVGLICFFTLCCFCDVYADGGCAAGYRLASSDDINYDNFIKTMQDTCPVGYQKYQLNTSLLYFLPYGTRCPTGQYYKNGACVAYAQDECQSGYVNAAPSASLSTMETSYSNGCVSGYSVFVNKRDVVHPMFTKCDAGYYPTVNGCVAYPMDDCPSGYHAALPNNAFARYNTSNECDTNYSLYDSDTPLCAQYVGTNTADLCTPLCLYGYSHTHADTCARLCGVPGMARLRSSNGVSLPLYTDKTTAHAFGFASSGGDVCYVNLWSGTGSGTINVNIEGNVYHGVE